jgi:putative membrane protein
MGRWTLQPPVVGPLVVAATLYLHGVRRAGWYRPGFDWPSSRIWCFLGGLAVVAVALVSPLHAAADRLLSVHMVQHLLLVQVAPPLLLLGRPVTLALAASPGPARARLAALAHGWPGRVLGSPLVGFGALSAVLWAAHFTPLYEATLTDPGVHALEHAAFLGSALLFWWPVVARDPGAGRLSYPGRVLYLFLSMPVMSLLGFVVSSSGRVLYPHYAATSRLTVLALSDQRLGGTIMWGGSMVVTAVALAAVLIDWMGRDEAEAARADLRRDGARGLGPGRVGVEAEGG